ncbi:retrovirus-related pol polyprotein from transposon TNT 1-94 [Tanacetum coccineum]|uniref:Retrovirus-related pol polyprotein from transposon TNT 1-94 n=1 Tax=Tanacetum coccineum TaxID=301880 RepID=A0ABQ5C4F4_9ASTR
MAESNVPQLVDKKGGSYSDIALRLEVGKFTKWKKCMLCYLTRIEPYYITCIKDGPFQFNSTDGTPKPEPQWSNDEGMVANQDQCLKIIIISCLPDDIMESFINSETAKETWIDLVHSYEGPSHTKENMIMDLKLEYNTLRAKDSESLSQTFTRYKTLLNELSNDGVKLSKHEINDFQENFDANVDERTSDEYLRYLDTEFYERALLAGSKGKIAILEAGLSNTQPAKTFDLDEEEVSFDDEQMVEIKQQLIAGKNHARNGEWVNITIKKVRIIELDHTTYAVSLKIVANYKAQPYQYASPSKEIQKLKAKPFPPCTHCSFNDHHPDDRQEYLLSHLSPMTPQLVQAATLVEELCTLPLITMSSIISKETRQGAHLVPRQWVLKKYDRYQELSTQIRPVSPISIHHEKYTIVIVDEYSRNLIEAARTMLNGLVLSKHFWTKAVSTAFYTQNRSIIVNRHDKTPYEVFHGRILDVSYFHVFGCPVFIHNHKDRLSKFDANADDGYFFRYSLYRSHQNDHSRQYQVEYDISYYIIPHSRKQATISELIDTQNVPNVIVLTKQNAPHTEETEGPPDLINTKEINEQIVHTEQIVQTKQIDQGTHNFIIELPITDYHPRENSEILLLTAEALVLDIIQTTHYKHVNITGEPTKGMLTRSMISKLRATSANECLFADFIFVIEPKKVSHALKHIKWVDVMQEELNQYHRNKVWTLVPAPRGKTIIGLKWVYKNKVEEHEIVIRNKAKLVA